MKICRYNVAGDDGEVIGANGERKAMAYRLCDYPLGVLPAWAEKFRGASILDAGMCDRCPLFTPKLSEPERERELF